MRGRLLVGLILVVAGVLFVNYVYLHDMIWQRHGGYVVLGLKSYGAALVGTIAVVVGAVLLHRGAPRG